MKTKIVLCAAVLAAGLSAFSALPKVGNLQVSQRWPFSPVVDIDFEVGAGGDDIDVDVTATWRGHSRPFAVKTVFNAYGRHHVEWDPRAAGFGGEPLVDFTVKLTPVPVTERMYLQIALSNQTSVAMSPGEVKWYGEDTVPLRGRGLSDTIVKYSMIFRRVRAGHGTIAYTNGYSQAILERPLTTAGGAMTSLIEKGQMSQREVRFSSDYFILMWLPPVAYGSVACFDYMGAGLDASKRDVTGVNDENQHGYAKCRGAASDGIQWPKTGFKVAEKSYVGHIRKWLRDHGALVTTDAILDLPTPAQLEVALRAGTDGNQLWAPKAGSTAYLPTAKKVSEAKVAIGPADATTSLADITNIVNGVSRWYWHPLNLEYQRKKAAGELKQEYDGETYPYWCWNCAGGGDNGNVANAWNIYDTTGFCPMGTLSAWTTDYSGEGWSGLDPVGDLNGGGSDCVAFGYLFNEKNLGLVEQVPGYRAARSVTSNSLGVHFVINTRDWMKNWRNEPAPAFSETIDTAQPEPIDVHTMSDGLVWQGRTPPSGVIAWSWAGAGEVVPDDAILSWHELLSDASGDSGVVSRGAAATGSAALPTWDGKADRLYDLTLTYRTNGVAAATATALVAQLAEKPILEPGTSKWRKVKAGAGALFSYSAAWKDSTAAAAKASFTVQPKGGAAATYALRGTSGFGAFLPDTMMPGYLGEFDTTLRFDDKQEYSASLLLVGGGTTLLIK